MYFTCETQLKRTLFTGAELAHLAQVKATWGMGAMPRSLYRESQRWPDSGFMVLTWTFTKPVCQQRRANRRCKV